MTDTAGSLLLRAGLVTAPQLAMAQRTRPASGGHVVEHLVATGVLEETALCRFFHERLLVPAVGLAELQRLTGDLIGLVPAELAAELRAVPVAIDAERRLLLAMADPSDSRAVDRIAAHARLVVRRAAAPPSAVAWALRHFCGVDTPLAGDLGMVAPGIRRRLPRAELVDFVYDQDTPLPAPVPFDETGSRPLVEPIDLTPRREHEHADRALAEAQAAFPGAGDPDAIARVLIGFLRRLCRRAAYFVVRGDQLVGWLGNGIGIHLDALRAATLPLAQPSTLRDVVVTRLAYRGPVRDALARDFLIDALGWAPSEILAIPIALGNQVIGILHGDEALHPIPAETILLITRLAESTLERTR